MSHQRDGGAPLPMQLANTRLCAQRRIATQYQVWLSQKGESLVTREYVYQGEKFVVSKPDDCEMKVAKDGVEATISTNETVGGYAATVQHGNVTTSTGANDAAGALDGACRIILETLDPKPTKKELCDGLDGLYDKIN